MLKVSEPSSHEDPQMIATAEAPQSIHADAEVDAKILELSILVARIADDFKGKDTLLLDMRAITPLVDYFIITTANSNRQMIGIAEEVRRVMKLRGVKIYGWEGEDAGSHWLLYDFGDFVLHVFTPEGRDLYRLEELWTDAPRIHWQEPGRVVEQSVEATPETEPVDDDESFTLEG
jgi:ribosome-associated protein